MQSQLILLLVQAGLTYGPQFVIDIAAILNNPNATVNDVVSAFSNLKPYSTYGIPSVVPTSPIFIPAQPFITTKSTLPTTSTDTILNK